MITRTDYLTASGKYPERMSDPGLTPEIENNIKVLLFRVNMLLDDLGLGEVIVSSGFRPASVNEATKGSASHSCHMDGRAVVIDDDDWSIKNLITKDVLTKYNLFMESPDSTSTWCHLDIKQRNNRIFIPF